MILGFKKINVVLVLGLVVATGTTAVVGLNLNNGQKLDCVSALKLKYNSTTLSKTLLQHGDGGLLMLTPLEENVQMTGFLSPVQFSRLHKNMEKNNLTVVSLKKTGTCEHEESGFEYTTFEGEYSSNNKKL